tara:strand:+ start:2991 stop:3923 length:933 start_codon:yes stop_codon:yes gene_type:complete
MRIVVTGGTGMVGSGFETVLSDHEFILIGSDDYDLTSQHEANMMLMDNEPDAIIHLAARVGGIKGNTDFIADFFSENIRINTNVLDAASEWEVSKVVSLLSTCVYPDVVSYPLTEDQIHHGEPHPSNFGYAYAKRMLDVQSRALRQQYGRNFVCAVPNNLYGLHDNFDLENGHVIPAIIRKIWEAKIGVSGPPTFWGSGKALREFTFASDLAKILIHVLENYDSPEPLNIGKTGELSIKSIVDHVCKLLEYSGEVNWDLEKPEGQMRKPSSNKSFLDLGWDNSRYTTIEDGLAKTCEWFKKTYPRVRGVV